MYHQPHFRFVDAHAKSIGRYDDPYLIIDPGFLPRAARLHVKAGMVVVGADPPAHQLFSDLLRTPAVAYVDDSAARHFVEYIDQLAFFAFGMSDDISEVVAGETFLKNAGIAAEGQPLLYILHDLRRCRRREGNDWYFGKNGPQVGNGQVGGAKIIAPLADAVRFIYGQQVDRHAGQARLQQLCSEPLR